jgi:hypothetical protein
MGMPIRARGKNAMNTGGYEFKHSRLFLERQWRQWERAAVEAPWPWARVM